MSDRHVEILGVRVARMGREAALQACESRHEAGQGGYVCFANVHTVTHSASEPALQSALAGAFLAVADGVPLLWASRLKGQAIESRVSGPDFMSELLRRKPSWRHGFVGGAPGQAEALAARFSLEDAACECPPLREFSSANARGDWTRLLERAGGRAPDVVWVGLGAPKQEKWMAEISPLAPGTLFFGVGAAFDFLTGTKARAPVWMQRSGLEWCFRLAQEPRRLWQRYLTTNSRFVARLALELARESVNKRRA
jgi:N-acetylglucosaminyldiphosphoundecaprenol N-acetyl-beta-D-mannosaminyltransferase